MRDLFNIFLDHVFTRQSNMEASYTSQFSELIYGDRFYLIQNFLKSQRMDNKIEHDALFLILFKIFSLDTNQLRNTVRGSNRKIKKESVNILKIQCYDRIRQFYFDNPYSKKYVSNKLGRTVVGADYFIPEFDLIWAVWYAYVEDYVNRHPSILRDIFHPSSRFRQLFGYRFLDTFFGHSKEPYTLRFTKGKIFDKNTVLIMQAKFSSMAKGLSSFPYLHAIENVLGHIKSYQELRHPRKSSISASGTPLSFHIDMNNIDPKDWSGNGLRRLKMAEIHNGDFPFSIAYYSRALPNYQRISSFYNQIKVGSYRQDLQDFILDRLINSYGAIEKRMKLNIHSASTGMPILKVDSSLMGIPQPILDMIKLTDDFNAGYLLGTATDEERSDRGWDHPSHTAVTEEIVKKLNPYVIATELPIWRKFGSKLLTGHNDILLKVGDTLFVCDYKPDGIGDPLTSVLSRSFIQSIPQVACYAKVLKKEYGAKRVVCVTFNHNNEAWIYHDSLLTDLESYMMNRGFSQYIIWKGFI